MMLISSRTLLLILLSSAIASSQSVLQPDEYTHPLPQPQTVSLLPQQSLKHHTETNVETKRSSVMLNKLVYALHKAFQPEDAEPQQMERRGQNHMNQQQYWSCYFNAVSCFRKR